MPQLTYSESAIEDVTGIKLRKSSKDVPSCAPKGFPIQVYLNIVYKVCHQVICRWDDGREACIAQFNDDKPPGSFFLDLSVFGEYDSACRKLSPELSSLGIDVHLNQVLDNIIGFAHKVENEEGNLGRKVLPIFALVKREHTVIVQPVDESSETSMASRESMIEFERRAYGLVPASKSSVEALLKRVEIDGSSLNESCRICLEEIAAQSVITSMPCKHMFHEECIARWLEQSHYCPICRFKMPTD